MLDTAAERRQRARNRLHEAVLSAGLVALTAAVAWLLLGPVGLLLLPLPLALVLLVRPRIPVGAVLSAYGARPLPPYAAPGLHRAVAVLARRAGLPRPPALFLVTSRVPNAFTVGRRDDAALAITDGLLALLGGAELLGVLAHEISHLRSGDTSVIGFSRSLGRLARALVPVEATAGEAVVRQGDPGDSYYLVRSGALRVEVDGVPVRTLSVGDGFGEIALLRNVPRTATVVAATASELYALDRGPFLAAVGGSASSRRVADELVDVRLGFA